MSVEQLALLFRGHDLVIHAAASKYVDRAELAARETTQVNVVGSMNVVQAAIVARVPSVVGISTDKAVQPVNVYGMSKAIMERLFQEAGEARNAAHETRFAVCRYGNVVGSTGSVIPMWRKAVAEKQPVRLTDPTMTRYWMSVDEAVELIEYAAYYARSGDVVIPRPRAMKMGELVAALVGPDGAAIDRIETIGLRPGEKIHESLLHEAESVRVRIVENEQRYFYVAPPGTSALGGAEFTLTSERPEAGWILGPEMLELIADAETV
jgi:UDP-N-acetylglucosamine 4,6-dehydratase